MPPLPRNESDLTAAVRNLDLLGTPPEPVFDDIARVASEITGTPTALVTLIDQEHVWFKAALGYDARQADRSEIFCSHTILQDDVLAVDDLRTDGRFAASSLVTGADGIRFYAGAPLRTAEGPALGTLCVMDTRPRTLTRSQVDALESLARQVAKELDLRAAPARLARTVPSRWTTSGRFRLVLLSPPPTARARQDRRLVHAPARSQHARRGGRPRDRRRRGHGRPRDGGRVGGGRADAGPAARARRRLRAGLVPRAPAARRRGARALTGGRAGPGDRRGVRCRRIVEVREAPWR